MYFLKEYQPNSHVGFYTIWILIFIYYLSWPGAGSRNFDIPAPAPAPAKSSGSLRLRLHNTVTYINDLPVFWKQLVRTNPSSLFRVLGHRLVPYLLLSTTCSYQECLNILLEKFPFNIFHCCSMCISLTKNPRLGMLIICSSPRLWIKIRLDPKSFKC